MAMFIDDYMKLRTNIGGKWVIAKPLSPFLWWRIKDAWKVITGEYQAVKFHEPPPERQRR